MGYNRKISTNVYRSLLARSGNECAFPGCPNSLFDSNHKLISQLCHIEPIGEHEVRYNPYLTDEIVNGYDNLVFLCYKHHVETNDDKIFTVEAMKKLKYEHEKKFITNPYTVDMSHVFQIIRDIDEYWKNVNKANNEEHILPDLKITINTQADYATLKNEVLKSIDSLENLMDIIKDDKQYWEIFNLGIPNHLNKIRVLLDHKEIKYLEEVIKTTPQDLEIRARLDKLRRDFLDQARNASFID